ncbi:MAG: TonB-dependent receptor [Pedobacter sp.]|jgi:TonB-linked SusC/RagA family outer membrane protein
MIKLTFVLLITALLQISSAASFSQTVSLKFKNARLETVLKEIGTQTGYDLVYITPLINEARPVSINVNNAPLRDVLEKSFSNQALTYTISNNTIIVQQKSSTLLPVPLLDIRTLTEKAPPSEVKGQITDSKGEALIGVSVKVKGTAIGVSSDANGRYSITVPDGSSVLVFTYIGYTTKEVSMSGRASLDVVLEQSSESLQEVVVVGYGTQKKSDLTGSVVSVTSKDIKDQAFSNINQALQGKVAGVTFTSTSGDPGEGVNVRIRGLNTFGSSGPLYVVDGMPMEAADINSINPNDIESTTVLKDGSAAAIYGSRSANGVILLTTKSGTNRVPSISFNSYYGIQSFNKFIPLLNSQQMADVINEAHVNGNFYPLQPAMNDPNNLKTSTDWQDEAINPAPIQDHSISVSGGNPNAKYAISGGVFDQESVLAFRTFKRYYSRVKTEFKIGKLTIGQSLIASRDQGLNLNFGNNLDLAYMMGAAPTMPVYDPNNDSGYAGPSPAVTGVNNRDNILGRRDMNRAYTWNNKLIGSAYAAYKIIPDLEFKINAGLNFGNRRFKNYVPQFQMNNRGSNTRSLTERLSESYEYLIENTLTYNKTIAKNYRINLLAGYTQQNFFFNTISGNRRDFPSNDIQVLSAGTGAFTIDGNQAENSLRSFLGRANITLFEKYLVTATIRRDGSSRFGSTNRYGNFPSLAFGWNLDQENFLKDSKLISGLKLRTSWGQLGNQDIGNYSNQTVVSTSSRYFFGADALAPAAVVNTLGNPNLRWERTTQSNIGIDLSLLQNKITFTADYWVKNTDGILVRTPISTVTGFARDSGPYQNAAELQNKGFEFLAGYRGNAGELKYGVSANLSTVRNKVLSLGAGSSIINLLENVYYSGTFVRTMPGMPMSHFYGHISDGIFQTQAEINAHASQPGAKPGDVRFRDINGDGKVDANDRTNIGDPWADFDYGFSADATFKGFDVNMSFYGTQGKQLYDGQGVYLETMQGEWNNKTTVLNRWKGPGTSNTLPRAVRGDTNQNNRGQSRYVLDADFLRMQNFQIGYSLPQNLIKRIGARNARVYFNGQNLFTITKYPNYNADTLGGLGFNDDSMSPLGFGVDTGSTPIPTVYSLGVNLTF